MGKKEYTIQIKSTKPPRKKSIPLIEKEKLIDTIILARLMKTNQKNNMVKVIDLYDPLDNIPLSSKEIRNIFLPCTVDLIN